MEFFHGFAQGFSFYSWGFTVGASFFGGLILFVVTAILKGIAHLISKS